MVQAFADGIELFRSNIGERVSFGNVLAEQSVEVLIGAAFPWMVGVGEVARHGKPGLEFFKEWYSVPLSKVMVLIISGSDLMIR